MSTVQLVAALGSLLILLAYAANQLRLLGTQNLSYSVLNLVGSGILTVVAVLESQWGFLLLEGVWALVSLLAVGRVVASRKRSEASR